MPGYSSWFAWLYGYTAFVTMEEALLPFERNMVFLPNTLPKWLSVIGVLTGLVVAIQSGPASRPEVDPDDIDVRNIRQYKLGQAVSLLALMAAYALLLRPIGFVAATTLFLDRGRHGPGRTAVSRPGSRVAVCLVVHLVSGAGGVGHFPSPPAVVFLRSPADA